MQAKMVDVTEIYSRVPQLNILITKHIWNYALLVHFDQQDFAVGVVERTWIICSDSRISRRLRDQGPPAKR